MFVAPGHKREAADDAYAVTVEDPLERVNLGGPVDDRGDGDQSAVEIVHQTAVRAAVLYQAPP